MRLASRERLFLLASGGVFFSSFSGPFARLRAQVLELLAGKLAGKLTAKVAAKLAPRLAYWPLSTPFPGSTDIAPALQEAAKLVAFAKLCGRACRLGRWQS